MSKQDVIDIHCHFINFDYLPDKYTIHLLKNKVGDLAHLFDEDDFKDRQAFINVLLKLSKYLKFKYLDEFLNALNKLDFMNNPDVIDTLMEEGEYFIPSDMRSEFRQGRQGKLILCTPLMMDFIRASNMPTPTTSSGVIPFKQQIKEHAFFAARFPWQILPFFHFHPKRPNVFDLFLEAIEEHGFIGVKLYPAMGFNPDCNHSPNGSVVNRNLKKLYSYIKTKNFGCRIPITAHAQNNSTQSVDLTMAQTRPYTRISNWEPMIEEFNLKINFAHYGGTQFLIFGHTPEKKFSIECRKTIRSLMTRYNNDSNKQIFSDISAHSKKTKKYFNQLNSDLNNKKRLIMFGTDLPVITASTMNKDVINRYYDKIDTDGKKERFFKRHALEFLFEKGQIPKNYIDFLKKNRDNGTINWDPLAPENLPEFVTMDSDGTYKVT
jgi:predicted TIM-barrel fold metal-dependent hydrolase